jgi:hypothetical protein
LILVYLSASGDCRANAQETINPERKFISTSEQLLGGDLSLLETNIIYQFDFVIAEHQ